MDATLDIAALPTEELEAQITRLAGELNAATYGQLRPLYLPGCDCHKHLDAHHIVHWSNGGETSLENLTLLCHHHHTLMHEGQYSVTRQADGQLVFPASGWHGHRSATCLIGIGHSRGSVIAGKRCHALGRVWREHGLCDGGA